MDDPLSLVFYALADPTRRAILATLSDADATYEELARQFLVDESAMETHLGILERAGLVIQLSGVRWSRCHLDPHQLKGVAEWIEQYKRFWTGSLDKLERYLRTAHK